jgi:phosphoribosylaminoimidazole-succinocarboxamide synthase
MKLLYEGSVKRVWEAPNREELDFEFTDAYSVFDWGQMPDLLPYKGESLAIMGEYFFKHLESQGIKTHFISRPTPNVLRVKRAQVLHPEIQEVDGRVSYRYPVEKYANAARRLIPLEVVFRFGIPPGSSFTERLTPAYAKQLGFEHVPKEGEKFSSPVIEFFSKLEETDRFLNPEEALFISGLSPVQFQKLIDLNRTAAQCLAQAFKRVGLELWDGKFEWISYDDAILLADSIGPDELRLVAPGDVKIQLSKEFLRQFYRKTSWYSDVVRAKKQAEVESKLDWKERVRERPPRLTPVFFETASVLYPSIASALTGEKIQGVKSMPIPILIERIQACLKNF